MGAKHLKPRTLFPTIHMVYEIVRTPDHSTGESWSTPAVTSPGSAKRFPRGPRTTQDGLIKPGGHLA